uniref:Protein krueppel n=1 Tax=Glossina brevipalpis TaxID=37001 RepID=A0A1A9WJD8_9MUSC
MRYEIVTDSCRVCLTKCKKLRSLYKPSEPDEEPPNEMLEKITGICLEKIDDQPLLPKNICKNCELSLTMAFEFRVKALKTQRIIELYLSNLSGAKECSVEEDEHNMLLIKEEFDDLIEMQQLQVDILDDSLVDCNIQILDSDDFIDETKSIENRHTEDEADADENNDEEIYEEETIYDGKDDAEDDEEILELEDFEVKKATPNDRTLQATDSNNDEEPIGTPENAFKSNTDPDIYTINVLDERENPWSQKTKARLKKENTGHICDVCGNVYAKRGRMMEHRQRHDKELKYACELCDKKFHMRELLRKHMYSHSGGKPLKCDYCSRTFYYESVRKAHEAVHKGHKPYVCDICGKAFCYAHTLKKHKLIHAEIKLYRCNYCNKDFRLQHHMKQHELTKMHQKALLVSKCSRKL